MFEHNGIFIPVVSCIDDDLLSVFLIGIYVYTRVMAIEALFAWNRYSGGLSIVAAASSTGAAVRRWLLLLLLVLPL